MRPIRNETRWRVENLVIAELQASGSQQSQRR
jgi:hypothetical protein